MLYLYNSLTRTKEKFVPLKDKKVKIYVCGITPYDTTHLGHAFTYVFFDVLVRYLNYKGYEVIYTQNVTDIDDDILKKATEEKRDWRELGNFWTNKFLADMKSLNVLPPTHFVKATGSISSMVQIIELLIKKSFAYQRNGNVYFEIRKFKDYGKLSHFNKKQMVLLSKERGGNPDDPLKKDPLDFLLWQKLRPDEPSWESPFGKGRPGWHIECSSMIQRFLGEQIDVHGGGRDLIYPHHESEIAQSESFTGEKPFVRFWMHTAMLLYLGEKMAKSLGNLIMVDSLLKHYSANVIRWTLLSHHYRTPWEFDQNELKDAEKNVSLVFNTIKNNSSENLINTEGLNLRHFVSLMDDDLSTPDALKFVLRLAITARKEKNKTKAKELQQVIKTGLFILGFNFSK